MKKALRMTAALIVFAVMMEFASDCADAEFDHNQQVVAEFKSHQTKAFP